MSNYSNISQTVFERSFARTAGLARLLVLEQLPKQRDREKYIEQRRAERGRPLNWNLRSDRSLRGNIKNEWEDEVPEWLEEDAISDYHSFVSPSGGYVRLLLTRLRPFHMAQGFTPVRSRSYCTQRTCC